MPPLVARCARMLLNAVRHACSDRSVIDPSLLRLCADLIGEEVLPQSVRWHRRDLSPALIAAWSAVHCAVIPPPPAAAFGASSGSAMPPRQRRSSKVD